jgi:hypothetical protein
MFSILFVLSKSSEFSKKFLLLLFTLVPLPHHACVSPSLAGAAYAAGCCEYAAMCFLLAST